MVHGYQRLSFNRQRVFRNWALVSTTGDVDGRTIGLETPPCIACGDTSHQAIAACPGPTVLLLQ